MALTEKASTYILVLLSLLAVSCGTSAPKDQTGGVLQQLPMAEIIGRVAPASDRIGQLSLPTSSTSSKDGERVIRHDEYAIDIGLKPHAVPGFASRFCRELQGELKSRGRILGEGHSDLGVCSFYLANQGVHAWVTVSPLAERGDRYWAMVVVDEW